MKNLAKLIGIIAFFAVIGFSMTACDDGNGGGGGDGGNNTVQFPHESTITAFGKTIAVKGDASIETANFNTAKGKLEEAMVALANDVDEFSPPEDKARFINMLNRTNFAIIIGAGNASPDANANKSMTIGVNYLLGNNRYTISVAIAQKVTSGAFEE